MGNRRVSFGPAELSTAGHHFSPSTTVVKASAAETSGGWTAIWAYQSSKASGFSPVQILLKRLGAKMATALRFVSKNRKSSRKVSSSLGRSRSYAETLDCHRAEAVEDCIEFLRSNSVTTSTY